MNKRPTTPGQTKGHYILFLTAVNCRTLGTNKIEQISEKSNLQSTVVREQQGMCYFSPTLLGTYQVRFHEGELPTLQLNCQENNNNEGQ